MIRKPFQAVIVSAMLATSGVSSAFAQGFPSQEGSEPPQLLPSYAEVNQDPQPSGDDGRPGWMKLGSKLFGKETPAKEPTVTKVASPEAPDDGQPGWKRLGSYLLNGKTKHDPTLMVPVEKSKARQEFDQAQELFRQEKYSRATRAFKSLAKQYEKTSIAEEALYMQAESLFKQDKLPAAQDAYAKLLVEFPTTRYLPQAVQRIYDIAYYWLEDSRLRSQGKDGKYNTFTRHVNLFDRTRPVFDTNGRAIEAIETIQQYDPLGPLSDDAGMMAGAHQFVNDSYIQAAGYYEQVVADQPNSEHAARAFLLGAQSYLRAYQGPNYDGQDLVNAERMTRMALARGNQLSEEQTKKLERDLRVIYLERARREFVVAEEYRRMRQPKAALFYYKLVAREFPDTDWARRAQEEANRLQTESTGGTPIATAPTREASNSDVDSLMEQPATQGTNSAASEPSSPKSLFSRLPFMSR